MSKEAEKWFWSSEYRHYHVFLEDANENKWDVVDTSNLGEILQAHADYVLQEKIKELHLILDNKYKSPWIKGFNAGVKWAIKLIKEE